MPAQPKALRSPKYALLSDDESDQSDDLSVIEPESAVVCQIVFMQDKSCITTISEESDEFLAQLEVDADF